MITYRDATPDDAATVEKLFRESFVDTFGHLYDPSDLATFLGEASVAAWREELEDPAMRLRLAEDGALAAGFARVGPGPIPKKASAPAIELRQLYVLPPWKGKGVSPVLMDWAIATAKSAGARHLYLSVFTENHRARRFYERFGFVEEGPYQFLVGNHVDEDVVMRLDL